MKKISKEHANVKGICQVCGHQVILPCEACQAEALRWWRRERPSVLQEEPSADLSVRLGNSDWQRRYEEVRTFRDTHGYPMWSEQ